MSKPFIPRAYQGQMTGHILELNRSSLWAGMGTGKTSATLAAIDLLHMVGDLTKPTLVVAPLRVARHTWSDEAAKWDQLKHLEIVPVIGTEPQRKAALRRNVPIFTTNYEQLPWLVEQFKTWPFGMVVADESTKLKGFRTRQGGSRARALGKVAHISERWVNLTGTPASNGLLDLWGQQWFVDSGQRLGRSFSAFEQRWFVKGYDGFSLEPQPFAQAQIEAALQDVCLTIDAKDWFDLREPIVNEVRVELPTKARALYQHMEKRMWMELAGQEIEAVNAAVKTMKCLQIANGAAFLEGGEAWEEIHDAKLQALESVVAEAAGAPVLVAYHFKPDRARILKAFPGALDLATDDGLRMAKQGKGRVWLAHPASLGHGVDGLQEHCTQLCFYGHWWSLEQHDQIIERIGPTRQAQSGFDRAVHVHYLIAVDTVDELVRERQVSKASVQNILREAMKRKTT